MEEKNQEFGTVFMNHLPSVKSLYVSLVLLFVFGLLTCTMVRIHDSYYSIMSGRDQVFCVMGCYFSFVGFLGASVIPMSPIKAAIVAGLILLTPETTISPSAEIVGAEQTFVIEQNHEIKQRHKHETQGKYLPVKVEDNNVFIQYYKVTFVRKPSFNEFNLNMIEGLHSKPWTQTDLCRVALLIFVSDILSEPYSTSFTQWVKTFFGAIGRTDYPNKPCKNKYVDWSKSRIKIENSFYTLVALYKSTGKSTIIFPKEPK